MKNIKIKGLSEKEIKIVSDLEFKRKYYFSRGDIKNHFKNKKEMTNTIYNLIKKGRFVRFNKDKYFLVPIKARLNKWTDEPFIIIDETMNGKDYFIGGWGAANYWRLTEQIPFRYDVYTVRRQGKYTLLGVEVIFHRTTLKSLNENVCEQEITGHKFKVLRKEATKIWMKLRN